MPIFMEELPLQLLPIVYPLMDFKYLFSALYSVFIQCVAFNVLDMQLKTISSFQSKLFDSQHRYSSIIPKNGKSSKLKVIIRSGTIFVVVKKEIAFLPRLSVITMSKPKKILTFSLYFVTEQCEYFSSVLGNLSRLSQKYVWIWIATHFSTKGSLNSFGEVHCTLLLWISGLFSKDWTCDIRPQRHLFEGLSFPTEQIARHGQKRCFCRKVFMRKRSNRMFSLRSGVEMAGAVPGELGCVHEPRPSCRVWQ